MNIYLCLPPCLSPSPSLEVLLCASRAYFEAYSRDNTNLGFIIPHLKCYTAAPSILKCNSYHRWGFFMELLIRCSGTEREFRGEHGVSHIVWKAPHNYNRNDYFVVAEAERCWFSRGSTHPPQFSSSPLFPFSQERFVVARCELLLLIIDSPFPLSNATLGWERTKWEGRDGRRAHDGEGGGVRLL